MSPTILTLVLGCSVMVSAQDFEDPKFVIDSLSFSSTLIKEAFAALNVDRRVNKIGLEDLNKLFYHGEANFAKQKFMDMVDKREEPGVVTILELARFMKKDPVKLAIHECIYVRSKALRRLCFADQILTYVYLALDHDTVVALFSALESNLKDGKLEIDEIKKLKKYDENFNDNAAEYFLLEIGRGKSTIDLPTFENYVLREDLHADFRGCKNDQTSKYDEQCLIKALMHYTTYDVTEYMTALVFSDMKNKKSDKVLDENEVKNAYGEDADATCVKKFFNIIDTQGDGTITYGEFRVYVKSHSVKLHLEKACLRGATVKPWKDNRYCIKWALLDLIKENHRQMMMSIPDLDMLFLFEELDRSNNGKIEEEQDLVNRLQWSKDKASKFIDEMDASGRTQNRKNGVVTLDEFNYYVDEPNVVYGLGDCLIQPAGEKRLTCYVGKLDKLITSILNKDQVDQFRRFYQKNINFPIRRQELEALGMTDKNQIDNFLIELGMGDEVVTVWEFTWFVKQQELSEKFTSEMRDVPQKLHAELLNYLKNIMTEYDTQELFRKLDKSTNFELEREDFANVNDAKLLDNMNFLDSSGRVSFLEFWLFLHTPSKADEKKLRKRSLEKDCTTQYQVQTEELDCYQRMIHQVN